MVGNEEVRKLVREELELLLKERKVEAEKIEDKIKELRVLIEETENEIKEFHTTSEGRLTSIENIISEVEPKVTEKKKEIEKIAKEIKKAKTETSKVRRELNKTVKDFLKKLAEAEAELEMVSISKDPKLLESVMGLVGKIRGEVGKVKRDIDYKIRELEKLALDIDAKVRREIVEPEEVEKIIEEEEKLKETEEEVSITKPKIVKPKKEKTEKPGALKDALDLVKRLTGQEIPIEIESSYIVDLNEVGMLTAYSPRLIDIIVPTYYFKDVYEIVESAKVEDVLVSIEWDVPYKEIKEGTVMFEFALTDVDDLLSSGFDIPSILQELINRNIPFTIAVGPGISKDVRKELERYLRQRKKLK